MSQHDDELLPLGTETILVIEDDDSIVEMLDDWLTELGYSVLMASHLEQATELEGPPDLAIADIMMGSENGVEIVRRIRERWPALPVVFMSGYTDGVLDAVPNTYFVRKPFTLKSMAAAARHALDHSVTVP